MAHEFRFLSPGMQKQCASMRRAMDRHISSIAKTPAEINDADNMACIRIWKPGKFSAGDANTAPDVRMHEDIPYKCFQSHDSTANPAWNPKDAPALWIQYHGTTPETARPYIAPTGAHDMYKAGEYMIWTDGTVKHATQDTAYGPDVWPDAWEDA
ncbi:MAG: hypothetical protein J6J78_02800 [Clostridia bacterium]|nr:hypothetical protein [Clostridia bacterium]